MRTVSALAGEHRISLGGGNGARLLHLGAAEDARVARAERLRDRRRRAQNVDDDADGRGDLLGRREGDVCAHGPPVR